MRCQDLACQAWLVAVSYLLAALAGAGGGMRGGESAGSAAERLVSGAACSRGRQPYPAVQTRDLRLKPEVFVQRLWRGGSGDRARAHSLGIAPIAQHWAQAAARRRAITAPAFGSLGGAHGHPANNESVSFILDNSGGASQPANPNRNKTSFSLNIWYG